MLAEVRLGRMNVRITHFSGKGSVTVMSAKGGGGTTVMPSKPAPTTDAPTVRGQRHLRLVPPSR